MSKIQEVINSILHFFEDPWARVEHYHPQNKSPQTYRLVSISLAKEIRIFADRLHDLARELEKHE